MKRYYFGIDLGGTFVKMGIVERRGKVIAKTQVPTRTAEGFCTIVSDMAAAAKKLILEAGFSAIDIAAAGVGSPGTVNSSAGEIVYSCNLGWRNVPLANVLEKELGMPVFVANDANAAALGEYYFGGGKKFRDMVFVTLGTGVGGGIVSQGKLIEGGKSAGAEIGHEVIKMGGERCACGRRGCFEAYASATALIRITKKHMLRCKDSEMWKISPDIENVDSKTAFEAARRSDPAANRAIAEYSRNLAEGLANLANVFRPDVILLGGGISKEGNALIAPVKKRFDGMIYGGTSYAPVEIAASRLKNDAGLLGAAAYAISRLKP